MPRPKVTRFELQLLEQLWKLGSASVREVQENLPEKDRPAYTTVQTIMYRLEEKKAVRRVKKIGNAHIFEPLHLSLSSGNGAGAERRPRCGHRPVEGSAQVQPIGGRSGKNRGTAGADRAVGPTPSPPPAVPRVSPIRMPSHPRRASASCPCNTDRCRC